MRRLALRSFVVAAVVLPAVGAAWWWSDFYRKPVPTTRVERGDVIAGVIVSGKLRTRQRVHVTVEVSATIARLPVAEGQHVQVGQELMALDDRVIVSEIAKAQAQVDLATHRLAELQAGARKEEIRQAHQALARAAADLAYQQGEHKRYSDVMRTGGATKAEVDLIASRVKQAQAEQAFAAAALDLLKAGTRPEQVESAKAQQRLAQAELEGLQAQHQRYVLRSPIAGVITSLDVHVGEVVAPGNLLMRIENPDEIEVRAALQESQLQGVQPGSPARVLTDEYPDQPLPAVVEKILPRVDPEQGAITVLLRLVQPATQPATTKPAILLMDNMSADIAIIHQEKHDVLRVRADAVTMDAGQAFVEVKAGGDFQRRPVQLGIRDGKFIEVVQGLQAGDELRLRE